MKTLIIVTHPDITSSVVNKRWVEELEKFPEKYVIHQLHRVYPTGEIDVFAEQRLIEQYDKIIFQFPFYWFSCPGFLKKWMDEVLTHGWAYGSKSGYKMSGKRIGLAMSVGVDEHEYQENEKYKYTIQELLRPFELSFAYVKAAYQPFFAFYGLEYNATAERVAQSVPAYLAYLESIDAVDMNCPV
ncbi:NAD(P)H-dependent oxidoreductase [Sphingobacterium griseoflavum]|nr:NAD(P)H-dependent oxidoreductase [Sphingobacterium griseoflavum]